MNFTINRHNSSILGLTLNAGLLISCIYRSCIMRRTEFVPFFAMTCIIASRSTNDLGRQQRFDEYEDSLMQGVLETSARHLMYLQLEQKYVMFFISILNLTVYFSISFVYFNCSISGNRYLGQSATFM